MSAPLLTPRAPNAGRFDVSIIGIVGLPGRYGGFETLADQLVQRLGGTLSLQVFCTRKGRTGPLPDRYQGASLSYLDWDANGWQSMPFDFVALWRAAPQSRALLVLGVSGCLLLPLIRLRSPRTRIVTNIDGLEWKRRKWGRVARWVLRVSEAFAVRFSHEVVADNLAIQQHVRSAYGRESTLIAYGGDHACVDPIDGPTPATRFAPGDYILGLCRIEPENNVREILQAFAQTPQSRIVFVGNWAVSDYARDVRASFGHLPNIELKDPIFEPAALATLRRQARAYVHGHSAGGTNPSLVEAMAAGMAVLAFDVDYNRHTTHGCASYWSDSRGLADLLGRLDQATLARNAQDMLKLARAHYTWALVGERYRKALMG